MTRVIVFLLCIFGTNAYCIAEVRHPNDWVYPMDRQPTGTEWDSWHSYDTHVGLDLMQSANSTVRAIADGDIISHSSSLGYYGSSGGAVGGAVLLKHKATDGTTFYAVYGHNFIKSGLKNGEHVKAGDVIAYTHAYTRDGQRQDHVHLGIRPNAVENDKPFRGFSTDGGDHGWVDPAEFLDTHYPVNEEGSGKKLSTCMPMPNTGGVLCWVHNGSDSSCANATNHFFFQYSKGYFWPTTNSACPPPIGGNLNITYELIDPASNSASVSFGSFVRSDPNSTAYVDEGYIDPVVNHKHAIGMHYVKYRMSGQSNWHDGTTTVSQGTAQNLHVRVKVKEKEGWEWNDIYVDLYYSENRWFSRSHDTLVATKHIKSLGKKEKESVYFNDINISNLSIGHHYYFADIRYSRPGLTDHNISSRSDDTEYVVIDVQDPNKLPVGYVDTANCSQISGWADDVDTNSPLNIHIYDGNTMIDNIYADDYRSDLGKSRGFTFAVPESLKNGTIHNMRIFAINEPQGENPLLVQGNFSLTCGNNDAVPTTRFYNSRVDAHFYSVNPVDQTRVPAKYPDWANHGTSFNAFPVAQTGTVPLYTCWTGKTHDYVLDLNQIGQYAPCQEQPYRLFDVYPTGGEGKIPVYLMYKESTDALILSNGEDDAYYLQNVHGYGFTSEDPFFWAPASLIAENVIVNTDDPVDATELAASVDEEEQKTTEEVFMILLF